MLKRMELLITRIRALPVPETIRDRDCAIRAGIEVTRNRKSRWIEASCHAVHNRTRKLDREDCLPLINASRAIVRLE